MTSMPPVSPGAPLSEVPTPQPIVDEQILADNIARVQGFMERAGRAFRPHVKTHKLPEVGRLQLAAGAVGINCQKLSEAQVFADAGFEDILVTYNIVGAGKLRMLRELHAQVPRLSVVADSSAVVAGLAGAVAPDRPLTVLVECDTGGRRCGVSSPEAALALAREISAAPSLRFGGLLTYPKPFGEVEAEPFLARSLALLDEAGIPAPVVSYGGTPSLFATGEVSAVTEHRARSYVYNDRALLAAGHCTEDQCALHVLATVVSRPAPDRAVIDAGSKALSSDLLGLEGFGTLVGLPGAIITSLSEEHGVVDLRALPEALQPQVGDVVRVLPNHCCVVSNLFDRIVFHRAGAVTRVLPVAARGSVW